MSLSHPHPHHFGSIKTQRRSSIRLLSSFSLLFATSLLFSLPPALAQSLPASRPSPFHHGAWEPRLPPPTIAPISPQRKTSPRPSPYRFFDRDEQTRRRYRIELVTIGGGDWLFTYFGHNAIRIQDRLLSSDLTYNFGTFSGRDPVKLLRDYLRNEMQYWLSVIPAHWLIRVYKRSDRTYTTRKLNLRPQEIRTLVRHLQNHATPQRRFYRYDHYQQNCSTKIRDALALALGPRFRQDAQVFGQQTYRKHVMRAVYPNPILLLLMDFGMGPFADRPLQRWEEFFLPKELEDYIASPRWTAIRGQPLAEPSVTHYTRQARPAFFLEPVSLTYGIGLFWLLLGLVFWRRPFFRLWVRTTLALFATLGSMLAFLIFFSWLPEPQRNANLLLYHPLHWLPFLLFAKKRWQSPSAQRILRLYLISHAWIGLIYLTLKSLQRLPPQMNTHHYAIAIAFFMLAALRLYYPPSPASSEQTVNPTASPKENAAPAS